MKFDKTVNQLLEQNVTGNGTLSNPSFPFPNMQRDRMMGPSRSNMPIQNVSRINPLNPHEKKNLLKAHLKNIVKQYLPELLDRNRYPKISNGFFAGMLDHNRIYVEDLIREVKLKYQSNPQFKEALSKIEHLLSNNESIIQATAEAVKNQLYPKPV